MEAPSVAPGKRAFDSPHALCGLALHRQLPGINEIMIFNVHFQMEKQTLKINFYQFLGFRSCLSCMLGFRAPHSGWKHMWLFWGWQWDEPTADFAWHQSYIALIWCRKDSKYYGTLCFLLFSSYLWLLIAEAFFDRHFARSEAANHQGEEQTARVCALRMPLLQGRRRRRTTGLFVWPSWWKVGELGTERTGISGVWDAVGPQFLRDF